jgi:hypothetical protein
VALLLAGRKIRRKRALPSQSTPSLEMMHASHALKNLGYRRSPQFVGAHADQLFVALPAAASEQSRRESVARLIQSLDAIATSNHLTRDAETSAGALLRLDYRSVGAITNSVHIIAPLPARASSPSSPRPGRHNVEARLAIILDDLGNDRAVGNAIFALPFPLTISVLPDHTHSIDIAEEAHRRGFEVMLHLPMQSVGNETWLRLHQECPRTVSLLFEQMMRRFPRRRRQQSSGSEPPPSAHGKLMPVLQAWNLFYVDSKTTVATVAMTPLAPGGPLSGNVAS